MVTIHTDATVEVDASDVLMAISLEELEEIVQERRSARPKVEKVSDPIDVLIENIDVQAMEEAVWRWRNGYRVDALFYLERALGEDWFGLADIKIAQAA